MTSMLFAGCGNDEISLQSDNIEPSSVSIETETISSENQKSSEDDIYKNIIEAKSHIDTYTDEEARDMLASSIMPVIDPFLDTIFTINSQTADYSDDIKEMYSEYSLESNKSSNYYQVLNGLNTESEFIKFDPWFVGTVPTSDPSVTGYEAFGFIVVKMKSDICQDGEYALPAKISLVNPDGEWAITSLNIIENALIENDDDHYFQDKSAEEEGKLHMHGTHVAEIDFNDPTTYLSTVERPYAED